MPEPVIPDEVNIAELFNRDPLSLTDPDINQIIAHLRKNRKVFVAAEKSGAAPSRGKAKGKALSSDQLTNLLGKITFNKT